MSHSDEYSRTGPETCRAGISPCPQTQAATRQQQATNSSPTQSATRHRWMAGRGVGIRTAGRGVRIRRLIPVAITAALAFSVVLSGHASASQTGNARRSTERIAGMAQPKATHARLVLRPNAAVIEAGGSRDYTAEGLDKAGRSLGDLTAYTRFSISPDGSCKNATCTPADPGRHTVTGTVDLGKRQVTGTADL